MKTTSVIVPWSQGLHLRIAATLVKISQPFRSQINLHFNSAVADARSALSLLLLSAGPGSRIEVQATGDDENEAIRAFQSFFDHHDDRETSTDWDDAEDSVVGAVVPA